MFILQRKAMMVLHSSDILPKKASPVPTGLLQGRVWRWKGGAFHPRADRGGLPVRVRRAGGIWGQFRGRKEEGGGEELQRETRSWCPGDWRLVAGRGLGQGSQCVLVYI